MGLIRFLSSIFSRRDNFYENYWQRIDKMVSEKVDNDTEIFFEKASIDEKMGLIADEAQKTHGLDSSPQSLKYLDKKFEMLEERYPKSNMVQSNDTEDLDQLRNNRPKDVEYSHKLGVLQNQAMAVFGEIVRIEFGGEWEEKDFSLGVGLSGKSNMNGGLAGVSVAVSEEKYRFVNIPNIVSQKMNGETTLFESFKSIEEDVKSEESLRNEKEVIENNFNKEDMIKRSQNIADGLELEYGPGGLKKLDKILQIIDYKSEIDDVDEFILEVGSFLGVVLEENLDLQIKVINDKFVIHLPKTDINMSLMEAAENCVKKQEKTLDETYNFFRQQENQIS